MLGFDRHWLTTAMSCGLVCVGSLVMSGCSDANPASTTLGGSAGEGGNAGSAGEGGSGGAQGGNGGNGGAGQGGAGGGGGSSSGMPNEMDLFINPFNKLSAHHRPIGADAEAGIPGGTNAPGAANPTYGAPGALNSRGRLANVKLFRCGDTEQGRKYVFRVNAANPNVNVKPSADAPAASNLPFMLKMPGNVMYPSNNGDSVIVLWPRNGASTDIADLFFNFDGATNTARVRREYPLGGTDVADGSDMWDRGSSASGIRFPGTVLRGFEINAKNPKPIRHTLNVTATRHNNAGAMDEAHVLGKTLVWPAYFTDSNSDDAANNRGDLPYGTRVFIRWQDRDKRNTLGLSPRGLVLFDQMLYYGFYIVDGQGQHVNKTGGVLQLRIDQDVTPEAVTDIDDQLQKMLPLLYPLRNPRPHKAETELTDELPYAGGGGPLPPDPANGVGSFNNAYDAPPF